VTNRLLLFTVILLFAARSAPAAEPRLEIKLANVRWQILPREVHGICVGPDGRTWYQLDPDAKGQSLVQIKSRLEREWKEHSPQVSGVELALLEPGGRAWFLTDFHRIVLGYDGRTWVEYQGSNKPANFGGGPISQGRFLNNHIARFVGGRAWFRGRGGIYSFDGQAWTVPEFADAADPKATVPMFAVSPGGKFAAAVYGNDLTLWTWREGKWTKGPNLKEEGIYSVDPFVVTDQGIMWFRYGEGLRSIAMPGAHGVEPNKEVDAVAALIKQLGDDDFVRREEASQKLADLGPVIKPRLAAALKVAEDEEVRLRLKKLVEKAAPLPGPQRPVVTKIGNYQVSEVKQIGQDDQGTLYIAAAKIQSGDGKSAPGLLMVDAAGEATLLANPPGMETWWRKGSDAPRDFYVARSGSLWLGQLPGAFPHACLDLKTNKIVAELPEVRVGGIVAVDKEGRAYTAGFHFPGTPTVIAFTPGAPDNRLTLAETKVPIVPATVPFVALDGSIWVERKVEGLSRFDGKDWTTVGPLEADKLTPVTSGEDGVVLYEGERKIFGGKGNHYLFQRDKLLGKGELRSLIQKHHALLAKAFSTPRSSRYAAHQVADFQPQRSVVVAADKGGNIWLLEENYKVAILAGDAWLDAADSLKASGSPSGGAGYMAPFGDNSRIYLSILGGSKALLGEVREGKLLFADGPNMTPSDGLPYSLRELTGELWLPANKLMRVSNVGFPGQVSLRLGQNGQAQEVQDSGWPMLVDESAFVWLGRIANQPQNKFALWRGGKIVQRLEITDTDGVRSLFSDKPGSVYAFATSGLIHLIADGEGPYRVDKTYVLPPLPSSQRLQHSRLGYLVAKTFTESPREVLVVLLSLPKE
jgi:hypothetical protein